MPDTIKPFSNGSEFRSWLSNNCNMCSKNYVEGRKSMCEIEAALAFAYVSDGQISPSIFDRMKFPGLNFNNNCPEIIIVCVLPRKE